MLGIIKGELKHHVPFTALGTVVGAGVLVAVVLTKMPQETSERLFGIFHPLHVFLSAIVIAGIHRRYSLTSRWWATLLIGVIGSIGVGTLSDSLIPYVGELLLGAHAEAHGDAHIGFIDPGLWYIVTPSAILGAVIGLRRPKTRVPHAGHVLLSTAASLFHMTMALGHDVNTWVFVTVPAFLFLAVWLPCCTSDIVFPLLFVPKHARPGATC
ncbi:MAG: hypothetical protein ACYTFO_02125 [Planctomycetota bacterium]